VRFFLGMLALHCNLGVLLSNSSFTWHKEFRASIRIPCLLFILFSRLDSFDCIKVNNRASSFSAGSRSEYFTFL